MNEKARDIAHLQRIERGYIRPEDTELRFDTILKTASPVELEVFLERLSASIALAITKTEDRRQQEIAKEKDPIKEVGPVADILPIVSDEVIQ